MSRGLPTVDEAGKRLKRVAVLLDQALNDLSANGGSSPCARVPVMLAEAATELQSFASWLTEPKKRRNEPLRLSADDRVTLGLQLKALLLKLNTADRLLASAAAFYSGWCAVSPPENYSLSGYQWESWSRSPALLALEG